MVNMIGSVCICKYVNDWSQKQYEYVIMYVYTVYSVM